MAVTKQKSTFTFSGSAKTGIIIGEQKTDPRDIHTVTVVGTENGGNDKEVVNIDEMTAKQLREYLTQIGKDFPSDATKAELKEIAKK